MSESAHLVRRWDARDPPARDVTHELRLRTLQRTDSTELGRLLWSGFGTDGPDGFSSEETALREARDTMGGKWGPMIWEASLLAVKQQAAVGGSVVVRDDHHQLLPLLAFLVTDPAHQRQGIAKSLIRETIARLDALNIHELHLSVDIDNPARELYAQVGFTEEIAR